MLESNFQFIGVIDNIQFKRAKRKDVNEGLFADSELRGEARGRLEILFEFVRDGNITVKQAAVKANLSEEEFQIAMIKAGF